MFQVFHLFQFPFGKHLIVFCAAGSNQNLLLKCPWKDCSHGISSQAKNHILPEILQETQILQDF